MNQTGTCLTVNLDTVDYLRAWELQKSLHTQVAEGTLPNLLLLLEHPHVYTLGRRGSLEDILATPEMLARQGIKVHHVDRGGEATYHGPGQLVGYPIVDLRTWGGPLRYVHALEEVLADTLADFGIAPETQEHPTGVWVGKSKIAAIGVKVSKGVTIHGFALNVDPDLSYFDHIVPCGVPGAQVTSMFSHLPRAVDVKSVVPVLVRQFGRVFGWHMERTTLDDLGQRIPSLSAIPSYG